MVTQKVPDGYNAPDPVTVKVTAGALTTEKLVSNSTNKTTSDATKTGDNAGVYAILIALMAALIGMAAAVILKRRGREL